MAKFGQNNNENEEPLLMTSDGRPMTSKKTQSDIFSTFAKWVVIGLMLIPRALAAIMEHFTEAGSVGAIGLGSFVFVAGVLFSCDTYWQSLFQGVALFPWFEKRWIGWGWLPGFALFPFRWWAGVVLNPAFVSALAISFAIQIIQSATIRNAAFKIPTTVVGISPKTVGLLAIATWSFDLIQTFSSRNPLGFSDPGDIFKCLMYNIFSIVSAELGYVVYRLLKAK